VSHVERVSEKVHNLFRSLLFLSFHRPPPNAETFAPVKARLADLDGTVLGGSPADFGKLIAEQTKKWRKMIRLAHIKSE
jgi:hypothetical protein